MSLELTVVPSFLTADNLDDCEKSLQEEADDE